MYPFLLNSANDRFYGPAFGRSPGEECCRTSAESCHYRLADLSINVDRILKWLLIVEFTDDAYPTRTGLPGDKNRVVAT